MLKKENNYAFIDSQNVHKGIQFLGWEKDWNIKRNTPPKDKTLSSVFRNGYMIMIPNLYNKSRSNNFIRSIISSELKQQ